MTDLQFTDLEIHPIRDFGDTATIANTDEEADYFSLFGRVDGELNDFFVCIGDYPSRDAAALIKQFWDNKKQGRLPQ